MKKLFLILLLLVFAVMPAYAAVGVRLNGTFCGTATDLSFANNTTITTDGSVYNITLTTTGAVALITSGTINNTSFYNCISNNTTSTNGTYSLATLANATTNNTTATNGTYTTITLATPTITNETVNNTTTTNGTINNVTIGLTTPLAANFTSVTATGIVNVTGNSTITGNLTVTGNTTLTGNVSANSVGNFTINGSVKLANASVAGVGTLVSGTVNVTSTYVTANSIILTTKYAALGAGANTTVLRINATNVGANFTVQGINTTAGTLCATDNSTFGWIVIN